MNFFAQIDQNLLSLTGVIATLLSVIFGIAAFYNSRTRKKHIEELERAQKQKDALHFRPAKSSHFGSRRLESTRSSRPNQSSTVSSTETSGSPAPKAAPVVKSAPRPEEPESEGPPLFRKVKPSGAAHLEADSETDEEDHYVWE